LDQVFSSDFARVCEAFTSHTRARRQRGRNNGRGNARPSLPAASPGCEHVKCRTRQTTPRSCAAPADAGGVAVYSPVGVLLVGLAQDRVDHPHAGLAVILALNRLNLRSDRHQIAVRLLNELKRGVHLIPLPQIQRCMCAGIVCKLIGSKVAGHLINFSGCDNLF